MCANHASKQKLLNKNHSSYLTSDSASIHIRLIKIIDSFLGFTLTPKPYKSKLPTFPISKTTPKTHHQPQNQHQKQIKNTKFLTYLVRMSFTSVSSPFCEKKSRILSSLTYFGKFFTQSLDLQRFPTNRRSETNWRLENQQALCERNPTLFAPFAFSLPF